MQNWKQKGDVIPMTAPYDTLSGKGALVGGIFGLAADDVLSAAIGQYVVTGVVDIAKSTTTYADGDAVYWDNTNKVATSTAQSNWLIGSAALIQTDGTSALGGASGDATVRVRLNGVRAKAVFKSTEATGTGSAQNIAHGLGVAPTLVIFYPSDTSVSTAGVYVVTEGVHTSTNVVVTVTTSKKFFAVAYA